MFLGCFTSTLPAHPLDVQEHPPRFADLPLTKRTSDQARGTIALSAEFGYNQ